VRALAIVVALAGVAHADDDLDPAVEPVSEANLETKTPRDGITMAAAFGPSFGVGFGISGSTGTGAALSLRLGHVMTPSSVLLLELVGASQLHQVATDSATLHNDDLRLLVGAQWYPRTTLWIRGGTGYGSYHEVFGGDKGDRTLRGLAGLFGFGLDIFRRHYLVLGFEFFISGTITKDGVMSSNAALFGVSYY
jgi:hypothetical protein